MSYRPKGRHVRIDRDFPEALGICDKTGFVFNRKDLVRQMEWRGNALIWTGFYVGLPYVDTPNEQLRPPILPPDPVPIFYPRLQQPQNITWSTASFATWSTPTIYRFSDQQEYDDGVMALPPAERLQQLQSLNWGWV
jgi:hypothetical protein